jgi:hypoxanthine phosphoribosyltransferase
MNKRFLEWRDIDAAIERLTANIKKSGIEISAIKGLQRGGLIPAVMLSHSLGIPMTENKIVSSSILIVDDICDTGKTLIPYKQTNNPIVTIHYKTSALLEPNFWFKIANEGEWIVYPWEQEDSETIPDYLKRPIM